METHVWHSKRSKMISMYGFKVSEKMATKSLRASYRFATERCVMYDSSYDACFQVFGEHADISESLKGFLGGVDVGKEVFRRGDLAGHAEFYHVSQFLSPVTFHWSPDSLILWIHPCAVGKFETMLDGVGVQYKRRKFVKFTLMGPRTTHILTDALPSHTENEFWSDLSKLVSLGSIKPGMIAGADVVDPRKTGIVKMSGREKQIVEHVDVTKHYPPTGSFWTHEPNGEFIPLLFIQNNTQKRNASNVMARELLSSVSLILPEGCGMLIWRHLIFSGARVIGQMELRSLYMQAHLGHFPSDFVGTDVGAVEFLREGLELKREWDKRPKAKRVAYEVPPWEISLSIFNGVDSVEVVDKRVALDKRETSGMDKRAAKMVLVECPNGKLSKYSRIYLQEELIGFVTSAGYSFADGKCIGIGSVVCDGSFAATVKNPIGQSKQVFLRAI